MLPVVVCCMLRIASLPRRRRYRRSCWPAGEGNAPHHPVERRIRRGWRRMVRRAHEALSLAYSRETMARPSRCSPWAVHIAANPQLGRHVFRAIMRAMEASSGSLSREIDSALALHSENERAMTASHRGTPPASRHAYCPPPDLRTDAPMHRPSPDHPV
jgi:hypothetical protein